MTDRRGTDLPAQDEDMLAAFHAEVARLMGLSQAAFAAVNPHALVPLVATIRATHSEVSPS